MKVYSMTATFGKLDHETLTLEPGLNVIHAPNEWGKSTWCAFLTAMLYGLDTRAHSTKSALSDREHYIPWSGAPMAGSMEIHWQGRDITVQRSTKGRTPMGDFKAFETHTGLPVPELTATNCGQLLMGVEKSVFLRTGFLRLTDLPVTQDENLRRRLNALVTTGDDSGTGEQLERKLRELKNRCRYNRTGLLPQAEAESDALERKLRELDSLQTQAAKLRREQSAVRDRLDTLENHRTALAYERFLADHARMVEAEQVFSQATEHLNHLSQRCAGHPDRALAEAKIPALEDLVQRQEALAREQLGQSPRPEPVRELPHLRGMNPDTAAATARADAAAWKKAAGIPPLLRLLPGLLVLMAGVGILLGLPEYAAAGWFTLALGCLGTAGGAAVALLRHRKSQTLILRYGEPDPDRWEALALGFANHARNLSKYEADRRSMEERQAALTEDIAALCGTNSPFSELTQWKNVLRDLDALEAVKRNRHQAQLTLETLRATVRHAPAPEKPDALDLSPAETARQISQANELLQGLHSRLGQCQGQMEAIGHREVLERELGAIRARIRELEKIRGAADLALQTLEEARRDLQRRFSPRITRRAQEILNRLTEGRYERLLLNEDLTLQTAAANEEVMRGSLWRSDGTADQLYLALRLAAAEALTPGAPLVLDDALVRFDDRRLAAAMAVLKEEARQRQILLFTCHSRESTYL
ncbi:MAG: AAA family ATPase [Oscillospiraceae bacterium]|nr:AAA family ATPase [Oscillospiraceae bacterium]